MTRNDSVTVSSRESWQRIMVPLSIEPELADPGILIDVDNMSRAIDDNSGWIAGCNRYLELCGQVGMLPGIVFCISDRFSQEVEMTILSPIEYLLPALWQGVAARLSSSRRGGVGELNSFLVPDACIGGGGQFV